MKNTSARKAGGKRLKDVKRQLRYAIMREDNLSRRIVRMEDDARMFPASGRVPLAYYEIESDKQNHDMWRYVWTFDRRALAYQGVQVDQLIKTIPRFAHRSFLEAIEAASGAYRMTKP